MKKVYFLILALVVAVTMIACASDKKTEEAKTMESASKESASSAPAFALKDDKGNDVKLNDYDGKVIILDFWATWCPPCRLEIPHFVELQKEYAEKGLQVIGVSLDQEGWDVVVPFMHEQGINYPILLGDQVVYKDYQALLPSGEREGIPFTFIIDRQGVIKEKFVGYRDKSVFEAAVKALL